MSGAGIVLIVLVGIVVVGGIAYLQYLAAKKRREEFAALAARNGWTYAAEDDRWVEAFEGAPFGRGHTRRAINVLTGAYDGRPLVAFDYKYSTTETTTVNGRTQTRTVVHPFSVVAIDAGVRFPALDIEPEGIFDRVVDAVTGGDIDFESEDFNRMFRVRCADRKFASDVVHPRMMELLMQHPDIACRFTGTYLLAAEQGDHSEARLSAQLALLDAVVDQVPDFVWRDTLGSVPPAQPSSRAAQPPGRRGRFLVNGGGAVVLVLFAVVLFGLVSLLTSYNRFVRQRTLVDESWHDIDVELTRRHDLIPNLVATVKGYAAHEAAVLEAVTRAREAAEAHRTDAPEQRAAYEGAVGVGVQAVLVRAEAYPDLRASAGFLDLQHQLTDTEDRLAAARRFYNGNVRAYNIRVQSLPSALVARVGGFTEREFFEADASARAVPDAG